jgi:hypothetical protein
MSKWVETIGLGRWYSGVGPWVRVDFCEIYGNLNGPRFLDILNWSVADSNARGFRGWDCGCGGGVDVGGGEWVGSWAWVDFCKVKRFFSLIIKSKSVFRSVGKIFERSTENDCDFVLPIRHSGRSATVCYDTVHGQSTLMQISHRCRNDT